MKKRSTLTHSSGGRILLAKRRGGRLWLHVEDGFSVVDMPISEKLAEELSEFLTDDWQPPPTATGTAPAPEQVTDESVKTDSDGTKSEDPAPIKKAPPGKCYRSSCGTCNGDGDRPGLFAGMRSPCPDCVPDP